MCFEWIRRTIPDLNFESVAGNRQMKKVGSRHYSKIL